MAGIKSTKEMIYDARSNDFGMIEIEIQGWTYEPAYQRFSVRITDYVVASQISNMYIPGVQMPISYSYPVRNTITQKDIIYTKEQVDSVFTQLGNPIEIGESFTEETDKFISETLLMITQANPIYRDAETGMVSLPSDWILIPPVGGGTASGTQSNP